MRLRSSIALGLATSSVLLLLVTPCLALAAEGSFDRTLNTNGPTYLYVDTGSGYVHVSPGSDNQVHIVAHVKANNKGWWSGGSSEGSPEDRVKKVVDNPPIQQQGNTIRIGKQQESWLRNISIDYEITTPATTQLEAGSGSGDIRVSRIVGSVKAETGSGGIEASAIGGNVNLETGSGDIRADLSSGRDVKAHTGSGSIRLGNVQGGLRAETGAGDIEVTGKPTSDWKIDTGSGSLTLNTQGAHSSLYAQTGSGNVHSDPPILTHGNQEHHRMSGEINGGGPMVRLETGSGNITIH